MAQRAASGFAARAGAGDVPAVPEHAGLGSRLFAYLLDSLVLFGFTMVFVTVAFLNIFLRSDSGRTDPTDATIWQSAALLMLTVPAWFLFNIVFASKRGQSVGQFVVGLRPATRSGGSPGLIRLIVYWLALHPLLFHPILAAFWFLFAYIVLALAEHGPVVIALVTIGLVSAVAPFASLLFALGDPQRRGIHDLIAGTRVVRVE
jgi:uncharacterized RDD family membrane protein YckC